MSLSPQEKAALRNSFQKMSLKAKASYIFTYYKLPIFLILLGLFALGHVAYRQVSKKEMALYLGLVNVSVGEDLQQALTVDYLNASGINIRKNQVKVYTGLYLSENPASEDHEYAYASRMKIMAAVNAKQLDVVMMNREAYDILSQSGYLLDLTDCLAEYQTHLVQNDVIEEDNTVEYQLGEADKLTVLTGQAVNGLDTAAIPLFQKAGFPDSVYLGIIANSPRQAESIRLIQYLFAS